MAKKITVVNLIPTYNERQNITPLLEQYLLLAKKLPRYKFLMLVVDDNSPDGTGEIVQRYQSKYKNIFLLKGRKRGLGVAMIRGLKYAVKALEADIVISNEADFAYDIKKIPFMLDQIKDGFDVVVASRHVKGGNTQGWTTNRRLNHWVANKLLATWVAGTSEVNDHNGAFRAVRVSGVLNKINLDNLNTAGFGFFNYYMYKLTAVTKKICEFPITYRFRTRGESKVSFNSKYVRTYLRDVVEYIMLCARIRKERLFG